MLRLVINYIVVYDFCGSAADIVHPSNPLHLIVCFELVGHALTFCHLFYEPKKHILSLLVYIGKVPIQFAFCEQGRIKTFPYPILTVTLAWHMRSVKTTGLSEGRKTKDEGPPGGAACGQLPGRDFTVGQKKKNRTEENLLRALF